MAILRKVEIFADSIFKGIQINPANMRYHINNQINIGMIEKKYSLEIKNHSKFGSTITKGLESIEKRLTGVGPYCDAIIMDYGSNDCDFDWKAISECPDSEHLPNTPLDVFTNTYIKIIELLKNKGIRPIITNLPPLDAQRYFQWFCKKLDKANVLKWLDSIDLIYRWQENYSRTIEKIAADTNTLLVDLRGAFLKNRILKNYLCEDGIHPNTNGQNVITQAFIDFMEKAISMGEILV